MIRNAIIREDRVRNAGGQDCYESVWADDGVTPCTLRVAAPRGYFPYRAGDVVMVALPGGDYTAGRIIGLFESAQVEPQDDGNTEIHARLNENGARGSLRFIAEDGRVDLGEGEPDDQEQVGLHAQLRADIDAIHDLLGSDFSDLLVLISAEIVKANGHTAVPFVTTLWDAAQVAAAPDSKPSSNVYAKAVT